MRVLQRKLGLEQTGRYDGLTAACVSGAQRVLGLEPTGVCDAETASALGEHATAGTVPDWFEGPVGPGSAGPGVLAVREHLGVPGPDAWDRALGDAIRRWQSARRIRPTGVLGEREARTLGNV